VLRVLLSNGADIEAEDDDGETALQLAAESGQVAAVQLLLWLERI
jgi:ankyrin repeat protein